MFPCMPKKLQNHKMTKKMYCIVIKEGVRKKNPEKLCPFDKPPRIPLGLPFFPRKKIDPLFFGGK